MILPIFTYMSFAYVKTSRRYNCEIFEWAVHREESEQQADTKLLHERLTKKQLHTHPRTPDSPWY